MIPFENERSLTESEQYARKILESDWKYVVRCTSGVKQDLEGGFPEVAEHVSREMMADTGSEFSNVFRPGVPDLLAFDESGDYLFVEVKNPEDGLRSTQLRWMRDFGGINAEIWFADSENEITDELDAENVSAFSFRDRKGSESGNRVAGDSGDSYLVELPKTLAAVLGIEQGETVSWTLKSKSELILDSK